jgi:hypothetical protein
MCVFKFLAIVYAASVVVAGIGVLFFLGKELRDYGKRDALAIFLPVYNLGIAIATIITIGEVLFYEIRRKW